ncbi:zf-HC2 domain-containing protein [Streptomyces oryzae]|uniref:Zf-HC2 domain-containing protein n=1 Tax=Streptomyces oryzae TaxID=1434886 RepID=A0ABS3XBI1_9ACTN|nr:zf-HC2 domain-containing protein [Streptomyces oryzae]MBO8192691.1 zf-HC2 domain-containing protein [Streptomyces oryzae]
MTSAEHHLGDRLAALVDGELGHDARERVLAHLATCQGCKAEADAQRRLKNVFADAAPPPPPAGLLARLQGLPADGGLHAGRLDDDDRGPGAPGGPSGGEPAAGSAFTATALPGGSTRSPWAFDHLPSGRSGGRSPLTPHRGFRIHEIPGPARADGAAERAVDRAAHRVADRAERERSASRGRRFAFAAAGAFSLAALALGGTLASGAAGGSGGTNADNPSANSVRSSASGSGAARDARRRGGDHRGGAQSTRASEPGPTFAPVASHGVAAPRARLTAPVSLLQRSASRPLSLLKPSRVSPATNGVGWYGESGAMGTFSSLRGSGALVPGGPEEPSAEVRLARSADRPDPTVLRSFPGRAPVATGSLSVSATATGPAGR